MAQELIELQQEPLKSWEQQPSETQKAFHAFTLYRDQTDSRSYQKVADALACSNNNVRQWAMRHDWRTRVKEWDLHLDEEERFKQVRERREMRKRHAQFGVNLQILAAQALAELNAVKAAGGALHMKPDDIAKFMEVGAKLERAARGEDVQGKYTQINVNLVETREDDIPAKPTVTVSGETVQ